MATNRLSDIILGMGVVIKAIEDWRSNGRPQVAMHRNCHILAKFWCSFTW